MILAGPGCAARNSSSGCSTKSDTRCRLAAGSSGNGGAPPGGSGAPAAQGQAGLNGLRVELRDARHTSIVATGSDGMQRKVSKLHYAALS